MKYELLRGRAADTIEVQQHVSGLASVPGDNTVEWKNREKC